MGFFDGHTTSSQPRRNKALDAPEKPDEMLDLSYAEDARTDQQCVGPVRHRGLRSRSNCRKPAQHTVDPRSRIQAKSRQFTPQDREDLAKEALAREATAQAQLDAMEPTARAAYRGGASSPRRSRPSSRVNAFRTQKETLKASYTAASGHHRQRERLGDLQVVSDSGATLQRAQDKIANMQARSSAMERAARVSVLETWVGATDDIQKSSIRWATPPRWTGARSALKAEVGAAPRPRSCRRKASTPRP